MPHIQTLGTLPAEFLITEGPGQISREQILVQAGPALPAGQVLGAIGTGEYVPYDNAAADGSEVALGILYAPLAASDVPRRAVMIARIAEVESTLLTGFDVAAKSDLAEHHIVVR